MKIYRKCIYRVNKDADPARIAKIVAATNAYVQRGMRVPISIGHTPGDEGEEASDTIPLDIGSDESATNFVTDGNRIYADMDIDPVFDDVAKRYRGVSIELYTDHVIGLIALLSYNRPALEVGPMKYALKYSHDGEHETHTILNEEEDIAMDVPAIKNLFAECLLQSDLSAQIKSLTDTVSQLALQVQSHSEEAEQLKWLFDEEQDAEDENELAPQEGEEATEPPEEAIAEDAQVEAEEHPELPEPEIEQIAEDHVAEGKGEELPAVEKKEEMGMALPSGTNTFVPGTEDTQPPKKKKNYEELELERETFRLQAENQRTISDDYAQRIAAAETERQTLAAEKAEIERKYSMLNRKNELIVLAQKYEFDPDKELVLCEKMDDSQFETHKTMVVTKYSKPPVHTARISLGELPKPVQPADDVIPKSKVAQVAKYSLDHKIPYEEAWAKREQIWRESSAS